MTDSFTPFTPIDLNNDNLNHKCFDYNKNNNNKLTCISNNTDTYLHLAEKNTPYYCEKCNFNCYKINDWKRHINTFKHNKSLSNEENKNLFFCDCGKKYNHRQSLFTHKKKCNFKININENNDNILDNKNVIYDKNIFDIFTQNQEFKDLILEQNKIIMELAKNAGNNNNNINSNNKTFNLQVFLNEKCKDALNINEFVNSLKLTLEDLENVGDKGFVNGITRIFLNGLKKLDVYKRPIHCSDLKRETMYLKNENVWEKDNENKENMKKVIKQIANKNINKIYEWKDKYPDCKYSDSKKNDQYSRIIIESMGASTIEEDQVLYEKIIKNIAKETVIDKTK
jgi:hypothetical protein